MAKKKINFTSAYADLEKIIKEIESDDIQIDELTQKIMDAKTLVSKIEEELRKVRTELDDLKG